MEGTESLKGRAGRTQGHVAAHDIDNVVGFFDLPNQASPVVSQRSTRVQESQQDPRNVLRIEFLLEAEFIGPLLGTL